MMPDGYAKVCCNDDAELAEEASWQKNTNSDDEKATNRYRRNVACILGGVGLVACAAMVLLMDTSAHETGKLTALQLFESPLIHEVATDNIIKINRMIGKGVLGPRGSVRHLVEGSFKNASAYLRNAHVTAAHAFDSIPLEEKHEKAIAHVLGYVSDDRISKLGLKIAHAMRDSASEDPEVVKFFVARALVPDMPELLELHHEMYPMGSPLPHADDGLKGSLSSKRIRMMKTVSNDWDHMYADATTENGRKLQSAYAVPGPSIGSLSGGDDLGPLGGTAAPIGIAENVVGVAGAAMEEAGVLLRIMKPLAKMMGNDLQVPTDVTTGIGAADFAMEFGSCEIDAIADEFNPLELAACPVAYSSQAMEASRDIFSYLGLLGDNNPANGVQGNHNGKNKHNAKLGILDDLGIADQKDVDSFDLFNSH